MEVVVTVDCVVVVIEDVDVVTVGGEGSVELPVGEFDIPRAATLASVARRSATRELSSSSDSSLSLSLSPSLSPAGAKGGRDRSKVCLLKLHWPPHWLHSVTVDIRSMRACWRIDFRSPSCKSVL